ncbi:non-ribosomal peptide synthetase [Bacillus cabrialesii]|uniref:Non-ribosomal peptide synthetase n=1 Tax=Bacillus cabrialesii subsp. tritici TaxID=2944916 RepID=A0ABT9DKM1_9BACI|nr:non-ribosomal peptide synthetase [Bacillus cabrialesii]MDO8225210.1 non-ribosomal peptide synthetase [Bacillus cabrialesii subsp. tritici]
MTKANSIQDIYPLSYMQEGMLFHSLLQKDSRAYVEQASFTIEGKVNPQYFQNSINALVARHDIFRTIFISQNVSSPQQVVLRERNVIVQEKDITHLNEEKQSQFIEQLKEEDRAQGFHLQKDMLMRITLIQTGEGQYTCIWTFHHIMMDGWCLSIVLKEFLHIYASYVNESAISLNPVQPYGRYIKWLMEQDKEQAVSYWEHYLSGHEQQTMLPKQKKTKGRSRQEHVTFSFSKEESSRLSELAAKEEVTLSTIFHTIWGILLQKYNNNDDAVFGSVISGRPAEIEDIEQMVGLFINTIPVRVQGEKTPFLQLIKDMQKDRLAAEAYSYHPLYEIQARSAVKQGLIDHILVFENYPVQQEIQMLNKQEHASDLFQIHNFTVADETNYSFYLMVAPGEEIHIKMSYDAEQHDRSFVLSVKGHLLNAVSQILNNPNLPPSEIDITTDHEKHQLIGKIADHAPVYETIHAMFEAQAEKTPDAYAVIDQACSLTYRELNKSANKLARQLRMKGVARQEPVAIMMERSAAFITSVLGILKAGGAIVPIDPYYPADRISYILNDCGCSHVVSQAHLSSSLENNYFITHAEDIESQEDGSNLQSVNNADDLLYMIYTSGTTGKPKGVQFEHRNMANLLKFEYTHSGIDFEADVLQFATPAFDVCYQEIFSALLKGGTLHIVPEAIKRDVPQLFAFINKHQTNIVFLPTAFIKMIFSERQFANSFPYGVKHLIAAGEQLMISDLFQGVLRERGIHLHNHYGPSETHVVSTYTIHPGDRIPEFPPIGKPIGCTDLYILNHQKQLQPCGVPGELYISGASVARGYVNHDKLTRDKFSSDPFRPGAIMYRTGDLARRLEDGNIEYIGRADNQVKIRGYRIEPQEIEVTLMNHPDIKETAILIRQDRSGEHELCAYYCSVQKLDAIDLRRYMASELPEYMIPAKWVWVDSIPLTPNGKVDQSALPEPDASICGNSYTAPRNLLEAKLSQIFEDVLKNGHIGIQDNFFDHGGHSLKATVLMSRIAKEFHVQVPLKDIFANPTVEELASIIRGAEENQYAAIEPAEERETYPVSSAQKRIYVLQQLDEGVAYNMPAVLELEGALDVAKLSAVCTELIRRHEPLRTSFVSGTDGEPVQRIHTEVPFTLSTETSIEGFVRPFDLSQAPLFRAGLIKVANEKHVLLVDMHHIISDGVSVQLLIREFTDLYANRQLKPLRIQYKDYAVWQQQFKKGDSYQKQETYWQQQFSGDLPVLELPTDKRRPAERQFTGGKVTFQMDKELTDRIKRLAHKNRSTLYMTLLALYSAFLSRLSGQDDIVIGSPIAGRPHADLEAVLGMFVNTLALRTCPAGNKTFEEFLKEVRQTALEAYEHQDYPFEELVDKLSVQREMSRNPLFDTTLVLQNMEQQKLKMKDVELQWSDLHHPISKFDISLYVTEHDAELFCQFEYSTALFEKATIQRWADLFTTLVEHTAVSPETELDNIPILTKEEERDFIESCHPVQGTGYPMNQTLHYALEMQAAKTPDQTAVVFEDGAMTYKELNEQANRIAWELIERGVKSETTVAIMGRRSPEMLIGIYGILKAGGVYLPIDPDYPEERISFLLEDSGTNILLLQSDGLHVPAFAGEVVSLNQTNSGLKHRLSNPNADVLPQSLAYVIYTSGSTGRPKGVEVEHRSAVNFLNSLQSRYQLNQSDVIMHKTSYSFDASIWELFWWPYAGASVYLLPQGGEKEPEVIAQAIEEQSITAMHFVPSMLHAFLEHIKYRPVPIKTKGLKRVFSGGEQLGTHLVSRFCELLPNVALTNSYGPTEATVEASFFDCPLHEKLERIPIGKPVHHVRLYILNQKQRMLPAGCIGELYIAGAGVARGYLNRPALTEERFLEDPFYPGERMYKTGDVARWLPDGHVEFLGRLDDQAKIRGYRIEPGEIEAALRSIEGIREAAVTVRTDSGEPELCAYIEGLRRNEVRAQLERLLPGYMIPAHLIEMEQWPVTPSGKLDRNALPAPGGAADAETYTAPRNVTEMKLAQLWEDVLKNGPVGIHDNFFDRGGHSLKATALVSRISKEFDVQMPLKDVFAHPTVEGLASVIREGTDSPYEAMKPAEQRETYPVSSAQKRIYVLQQLEDGGTGYNMPAVLELEGKLNPERLDRAFKELIKRHESLRTSFEQDEGGEPVQRIYDKVPFALQTAVLGEQTEQEAAAAFIKPFDLSRAPLFRAQIVKVSDKRHLLLVDMHHIISDGVSVNILIREFGELYNNRTLPALHIQYKDYAVWQDGYKKGDAYQTQETYWLKQLEGELPVLDLPADHTRPPVRSFAGDKVSFTLDQEASSGLHKLARENGSTLYMVLLAAYTALLSRLSGQEDIIVGSPIAGRPHKDLEPILGMFVNTLALRTRPEGGKPFVQYLQEVRETALEAYEHQDYPFEELVDKLGVTRDMSRNPLFDTMLVVQNNDYEPLHLHNLQMKPAEVSHLVSKFDLTLQASEGDGNIHFLFEYSTALFEKTTIERWASHLTNVLRIIGKNPEVTLNRIDTLTQEERNQLLNEFNTGKANQYEEQTISQLFEQQAARTPKASALVIGDKTLTYQELDEWSNGIAHTLRSRGVKPDTPVGIMMPRSFSMIAAILGVWKAGGCYVPIDPEYPSERKRYILSDSGTKLLLTVNEADRRADDDFEGEILTVQDAKAYDKSPLPQVSSAHHLAYIIYTSGTTGRPKGVMVEHKGIANTLQWRRSAYAFNETDTILQLFSFSFDGFLTSMFTPLLSGAKAVLLYEEEAKDILAIKHQLSRHRITHMIIVPVLYRALLDVVQPEDVMALRVVTLAGEAADRELIDRSMAICPHTELANEYGPTENSVATTVMRHMEKQTYVSIGQPIDGTQVLILNSNHQLQPIGVAGELCIAGTGIARGYVNLPELTESAFIQNPFKPETRMYRTGDAARWMADGTLEYLGRIDDQVKIRGYRVETKEIEAVIRCINGVQDAAVVAHETASGQTELSAYVVTKPELSTNTVRSALQNKLPVFMHPAYIEKLDSLPLSPNGKLDRRALPKPVSKREAERPFLVPASKMEQILADIWKEVLGAEKIGTADSFFELGGDSIKALQVSARLHRIGKQMAVKDLFSHPTIQELAAYIRDSHTSSSQASVEGDVQWSPVQKWFLSQDIKEKHHFNQSVMLHRSTSIQEEALRKTLKAIACHHDALRMVFSQSEQGNWNQYNRPISHSDDALYGLQMIDLSAPEDTNGNRAYEPIIKHHVRDIQQKMDLKNGPLLQAGLFRTTDGDFLFLSAHHFVVDGISWRVLLEDLSLGYRQAAGGEDIKLPPKTSSFKAYAKKLSGYAESQQLIKQLKYWRETEEYQTEALPFDQIDGPIANERKRSTISFTLNDKETAALLKDANSAYNTDTQDLLLASVILALRHWTNQSAFKLSLESHGREDVLDGVDVSRTVGWFTAIYPLLVKLSADLPDSEEGMVHVLKTTKDTLRRVPDKGFGYGVIKYLTPPDKKDINFTGAPEISFNYLGQFESGSPAEAPEEDAFSFSPLGAGDDISTTWNREQSLDISAIAAEGKMTVNMTYDIARFQRKTIEQLSETCRQFLLQLIEHCQNKSETEKTISDFDDQELTEDALQEIADMLSFH